MELRSEVYVRYSQAILFACLGLCFFIIPKYFFSLNQGGVSNYGTSGPTIPLFSVGFGAVALGSLLAGLKLPASTKSHNSVRWVLIGFGILYSLVLVTTFPYKQNIAYEYLHQAAAFSLSVAMLACVLWLRFKLVHDTKIKRAFLVYTIGFAIGLLTLLEVVHLLFSAQLVCGLSFGYMLAYAVTVFVGAGEKTRRP